MKRLLIIVPIYGSYRSFLKGLAAWLSERGWEVHVATNLTRATIEEDVAQLHDIAIPRGANPLQLLKASRSLTTLIRTLRPTVVHAHFSVGMLVLALARRVKGVRTLGTFQGMRFPLASGLSRCLFKLVECFTISRLDQSWVLTSDDFDAVPKGVRQKLAIQEGYGFGCNIEHFDSKRFSASDKQALRSALEISSGDYVFIFVGRLTAFKGFPLALEAFQELRKELEDIHFLVVGEFDPQHPLDLTTLNSLDGVHHVGWQDDPTPYLVIANTMVFPSEREGMPVCLMEALSMGRAIITTNSRGCGELAQLSSMDTVDINLSSILEGLRTASLNKTSTLNSMKVREQVDRSRFYRMLFRIYSEIC